MDERVSRWIWVQRQLAPLTHRQRIAALEDAIEYLSQREHVDGTLTRAAQAWIWHAERHERRLRPQGVAVPEGAVRARLERELVALRYCGDSFWSIDELKASLGQRR